MEEASSITPIIKAIQTITKVHPLKIITNRSFVGAGGHALEPVGIFNLPFTSTGKEETSMTVQNDVIVMKTLNSGAIMVLDLIRKMGLIYKS